MADIAEAKRLVDALVVDMAGRGFKVDAHGIRVTANNPDSEPSAESAHGTLLNPGLRQTVVLQPHHDHGGALWWFWEWAGPQRGSPAEYEPLCPGHETTEAASRIARVLAMPARTEA